MNHAETSLKGVDLSRHQSSSSSPHPLSPEVVLPFPHSNSEAAPTLHEHSGLLETVNQGGIRGLQTLIMTDYTFGAPTFPLYVSKPFKNIKTWSKRAFVGPGLDLHDARWPDVQDRISRTVKTKQWNVKWLKVGTNILQIQVWNVGFILQKNQEKGALRQVHPAESGLIRLVKLLKPGQHGTKEGSESYGSL